MLIKRIGVLALGNSASQVINFLFGIILVRVLTVNEYSLYKLGMLLVMTISPFIMMGVPLTLSYFLPRSLSREEKKAYTVQTFLLLCAIGGIVCLALVLLRAPLSHFYSQPLLRQFAWVFGVVMVCEIVSSAYASFLAAEDRNKHLAVYTAVFSSLKVGVLLLSMLFRDKLLWFLLLLVITSVARALYVGWDTYRWFWRVACAISAQTLKKQLRFALPLGLTSLAITFNSVCDKNAVSILYDPASYALYVNGAFDIAFIGILSSSIVAVMLPHISGTYRRDDQVANDSIITTYRRIIMISAFLLVPLIAVLMTFADGIVQLIFSATYLASAPIFRIYCITIVGKILNLGVLITAADRQRGLLVASVACGVLEVGLVLLLHFLFGFDHIVWGPAVATILLNVIMILQVKAIYRQPSVSVVLPMRQLILISLSCAVVALLATVCRRLLPFAAVTTTIVLAPAQYAFSVVLSSLLLRLRWKDLRPLLRAL